MSRTSHQVLNITALFCNAIFYFFNFFNCDHAVLFFLTSVLCDPILKCSFCFIYITLWNSWHKKPHPEGISLYASLNCRTFLTFEAYYSGLSVVGWHYTVHLCDITQWSTVLPLSKMYLVLIWTNVEDL